MSEPDPSEWIKAELRGLRELAERERQHVVQRFDEVNKLREQVLQERGVFVRHETINALADRVNKLEATGITRDDHERVVTRVNKLETLGPLVALIAAVVGTVLGYTVEHLWR